MSPISRCVSTIGILPEGPFLVLGWKRSSRSRSSQRYAPPPSAADCLARDREPLFTSVWREGPQRTAARGVGGLGGRIIPASARELRQLGWPRQGPSTVSYGEAEQKRLPTHVPMPRKARAGSVRLHRTRLRGEGSMVPRRTVCGRRPWSEALAGGGPSIPIPFHPQKWSRHSHPW